MNIPKTAKCLEENSPIQGDKLIRLWGQLYWSAPYNLFCKEGLEK